MFAKFSSNICQRERWKRFSRKSCLLMQVQDEPRFYKDQKIFKSMTKNAIFDYFGHMLRFEFPKNNCHICNQHLCLLSYWNHYPQIYHNAKISAKKKFQIWDQKFGVVLRWKLRKLILFLKSTLSNSSIDKVLRKKQETWNLGHIESTNRL